MRTLFSSTKGFAVALAMVSLGMLWAPYQAAAFSRAKGRGAELFAQRGCAHCHGPAGVGGGTGPDLQLVRKRMTKQQMRTQIDNGGMTMPAFGKVLTAHQINDLIAYLRARRKLIPVPTKAHQGDPVRTTTTNPGAD
ncbi:MAG: c-type cytochrome [Acidobacteriaceae bacterium]